jgi:TRAP-type mannitol/chloroaromatic compound transport system permease small subunit
MSMKTIRWVAPWLVLVLMLAVAGDALACPNCKEAVANQAGDAGRQATGYFWSILLMIAAPFTLLGTGAAMVARAVKRGTMPEL